MCTGAQVTPNHVADFPYRTSCGRLSPVELEQLHRLNPERICQPADIVDRDIALAALDRTDEGAVQAGQLAELLLRETTRLPRGPDVGGERFAEV